mmetsp:Transcript_62111/g.131196  ORF Transcript_62111/g.131196 Transcript_62111/m.131196 type:complete len:583 (-) Transcript_62111:970-2718(-)
MWTRFESWAGKAAASGSRTHERAFGTLISALLLLGCLGGCVFSWLERDLELQRYELNRAVYESLSNSTDFEYCNEPEFQKLGYCKQHDELEEQLRLFLENAGNSLTDRYQWTWIGSTFFVFHLSSTVGYATEGAPLSNGGKFFAVLFGAVGIPLFGCLLLVTSSRVLRAARSLLSPLLCCLGGSLESSGRAANGGGGGWRAPEMLRLAFILVVLLWLGAAVFFSYVEGWSYARSIFFCFVTFSTVGIGTDVPETLVGRAASVLYVFLTLSLSLGIYRSVGRRRKEALGLPPLGAGSGTAIEQSLRSKPAAICFGVVLLFAAVGGWVLSSYERPYELRRYVRAASIYEGLNELSEFSGCDDEFIKGMEFCRNVPIFRKHLHTYFGPNTPNSMVDKHHWTGFGAASFVLSLASTIGYGAQTPHTHEGKVITVVVGIFVIPLFWYCMLVWGDAFRSVVEGFAQPTLEIVPAISITPLSSSTAPAATTSSNEGCSSNSSNNNNKYQGTNTKTNHDSAKHSQTTTLEHGAVDKLFHPCDTVVFAEPERPPAAATAATTTKTRSTTAQEAPSCPKLRPLKPTRTGTRC